jgi:Ca2+-binding RTX toxin-like protein
LDLERLEPRDTPSVVYANGVVTMTGTDVRDAFYCLNDFRFAGMNRYVQVTNNQIVADIDVPWNPSLVVVANLGGGNDLFSDATSSGEFDLVHGGDGDDYVSGGQGGGALYGDAGNDTLYAVDHADWARVRPNEVYLDGGVGADTISCGYGPDAVKYDPADTVWHFATTPDFYGFTDRYVF